MIQYTDALKLEYIRLYQSTVIRQDKLPEIDNHAVQIIANKARYSAVESQINVPWYFIGLIHTMESNRDFDTHLHNGDPLTGRTVRVPSGRPVDGNPPFTWEESALDALKQERLDQENDWSLPKMLFNLEAYNGWGYRLYHPSVLSPYLWSYCNHYTRGKYVSDGYFSAYTVSRQAGSAVILKRLEQRNEIPSFGLGGSVLSFFFYSNQEQSRVKDLQRFLTTFEGMSLFVDGIPGDQTSEACLRIFGEYLNGDVRRNH